MKKIKVNNKGVTLLELLVVLAFIGIVLQIVFSIFLLGDRSFKLGRDKVFAQQSGRMVSEIIIKELRASKDLFTTVVGATGKDYSIKLHNGELVKTTFIDGVESESKILSSSPVIELKFNRQLTDSKGIVKGHIKSKEGNQEISFEFNILLENIVDSEIVLDDVDEIYYRKYEWNII